MKELYQGSYLRIVLLEDINVLIYSWNDKTSKMTEDDYKTETLKYLEIVLEHKIEKQISDRQNLDFTISVDLQTWLANEIITPVTAKVKIKLAILLCEEIFTQISFEQALDEVVKPNFIQALFGTKESALEWLEQF